jgi:hypothetical protein
MVPETDRSIPRDLEFLVLTCLRKNPHTRARRFHHGGIPRRDLSSHVGLCSIPAYIDRFLPILTLPFTISSFVST